MKSVFGLFRRALSDEPKLHPLDRRLAKQWIKRRLVAVFPELGYDPVALERTYQELSLEPRAGGVGDAPTYFEITLPESSRLDHDSNPLPHGGWSAPSHKR